MKLEYNATRLACSLILLIIIGLTYPYRGECACCWFFEWSTLDINKHFGNKSINPLNTNLVQTTLTCEILVIYFGIVATSKQHNKLVAGEVIYVPLLFPLGCASLTTKMELCLPIQPLINHGPNYVLLEIHLFSKIYPAKTCRSKGRNTESIDWFKLLSCTRMICFWLNCDLN